MRYEFSIHGNTLKEIKDQALELALILDLGQEAKHRNAEPVKEAEPSKKEAPKSAEVSLRDMQTRAAEFAREHGGGAAKAILAEFGAGKLSEVPKDKWAKVLERFGG